MVVDGASTLYWERVRMSNGDYMTIKHELAGSNTGLNNRHEEGNFDAVERPQHYTKGPMEVIDIIEQYGFCDDFRLGNCVKYLFRHKLKGNPLQDLKKARWYLDRLIKSMEKEG